MHNRVTGLSVAMRPEGRRSTDVSQKMEGNLVWERDHDDYTAVAADADDDDNDEVINVFLLLKVDKLWLLQKASCKAVKLLCCH